MSTSEPAEARPAGPGGDHVDCTEVVLRLFEYVDNEAQAEDGRRIKQHLDACRSCLREYERDVLLKSMVRRACSGERAPEALRTAILTRISGTSPEGSGSVTSAKVVERRTR